MPTSSYARIAIDDDDHVERMDDIRIVKQQQRQQQQHSMMEASIQPASTFEIDAGDDDGDDYDDKYNDDIDLEQQPQHQHCNNNTKHKHKKHQKLAPPSQYICPLTLQVMQDPFNDGCGHCFERDAIVNWLDYHAMCPISRKPLQFADLRQAKGLQRNIEAWCQQHYDAHDNLSTIYCLDDYDNNDNDNDDDNSTSQTTTSGSFHSQLELMLLPQERKVLQIIKLRAKDRRQRHEYAKCLWIIALVTATFLVVATCLAVKFLEMELRGPI
jgi:hypothetical protein